MEQLEQAIAEVKKSIADYKTNTDTSVESQKAQIAAIEEKLKSLDGLAKTEEVEAKLKAIQDQFNELATKANEGGKNVEGKLSFTQSLSKAIGDQADDLKALGNKKSASKEIDLNLKDMTFTDFSGTSYDEYTTEYRREVYVPPFGPVWLRNLLPSATTTSGAIFYLRSTGATGSAAIWDGKATPLDAKPDVAFTFESVTEEVEWIAGTTRIPRQMLDDAAFLRTFIPNRLVYGPEGVLKAENDYIYSKMTDPANSTAYNGTKTVPVEMIYDAALGQLRDNYFNPSYILMNNRDVVDFIGLHKATGSGIYNLPSGVVAVINGNQLYIGGLPVIGMPQFPKGEFAVFDRNSLQFITRMSTEVRVSEDDRDNFVKNLITFRAEERVALLAFDKSAIITGSFTS